MGLGRKSLYGGRRRRGDLDRHPSGHATVRRVRRTVARDRSAAFAYETSFCAASRRDATLSQLITLANAAT